MIKCSVTLLLEELVSQIVSTNHCLLSLHAKPWEISIANQAFLKSDRTELQATKTKTIKVQKCILNSLGLSAKSQVILNVGEVFLFLIKCVIKHIDSLVTLTYMETVHL